MDERSLTNLLRDGLGDARQRTGACPDENILAAYVDRRLTAGETASLERHLADCGQCLALVGLLVRATDADDTSSMPVGPIGAAEATPTAFPQGVARRSWWQSVQGLAAAASVLIAVAAIVRLGMPPDGRESVPPEMRVTRSGTAALPVPRVLDPAPGTVVDAARLAVRWTPVPDSRDYRARILNDAGDVLATERTAATEWRPEPAPALVGGRNYYVVVDAELADGRIVSSEHVPFRSTD